jgi:hypothetical protein
MIHLARPDLVSRSRDRGPATPAAPRPGFWQRLARRTAQRLRALLRRAPAELAKPAPRKSARRRPAQPARPRPAANPMHEKAAGAVRDMQAHGECLLPNWLSNVEIREYDLSDKVRQRLFGTGPSA